ncbi:hypothetical protein Y032_0070g486 [Ancylostoma ceylanicum]|uniref:Uncharacterized protein n=1 Tax=Ancylostoma ceylanicum TaxID=53326 RepID=A0A016TXS4_9BILA|nr:hypothetical protein Y032_0070g486 [Ancylostoma ceylanicum]
MDLDLGKDGKMKTKWKESQNMRRYNTLRPWQLEESLKESQRCGNGFRYIYSLNHYSSLLARRKATYSLETLCLGSSMDNDIGLIRLISMVPSIVPLRILKAYPPICSQLQVFAVYFARKSSQMVLLCFQSCVSSELRQVLISIFSYVALLNVKNNSRCYDFISCIWTTLCMFNNSGSMYAFAFYSIYSNSYSSQFIAVVQLMSIK